MKLTGIRSRQRIGAASQRQKAGLPSTSSLCRPVESVDIPDEEQVLLLAMRQLHGMPDFDADRVAGIREDLEQGRITFNAGEVVQLILQHHGIST